MSRNSQGNDFHVMRFSKGIISLSKIGKGGISSLEVWNISINVHIPTEHRCDRFINLFKKVIHALVSGKTKIKGDNLLTVITKNEFYCLHDDDNTWWEMGFLDTDVHINYIYTVINWI